MIHKIAELSPQQILAVAIAIERNNQKVLRNFSEMFEGYDETVARNFEDMAQEESNHEEFLVQKFKKMFGKDIPVVSPHDIEGIVEAALLDDSEFLIFDKFKAQQIFQSAWETEKKAREFYEKASKTVKDHILKNLFHELAEMEKDHAHWLDEKLGRSKGKHPG